MIIKSMNDIVDLDELILILLMFEAYFQMHSINLSISLINQRAKIIEKAMTKVRKFRIEK